MEESAMKSFKKLVLGFICLVFLAGCMAGMKAELKMSMGKYEEAIDIYKEVVAKSPDDTYARSRLGFAYFKSNKIDEAIAVFQKVLQDEPGEPFSTLYLGMCYMNKEELGKTIELWQGYKNPEMQLVEDEVKRLLTLVMMANSQKMAKQALAEEDKLAGANLAENTIAVTYFQDLSPDKSLKAFQKALAAMVITDLSKVESLKVVERTNLQALIDEMKLAQAGIVDPSTAARVGRLLKASNVVSGSIALGSYEVTVSQASSTTAESKGSASFKVPTDEFFKLPAAIIQSIAKNSGITLTEAEKNAIGAIHTKSLEAFEFFGNALAALDEGNWAQAKDFFAKAVKADPNFQMAVDGGDSSPGDDAPGISAVKSVDVQAITNAVSQGVSNATQAQQAADQAAQDATDAGGGGDGGGGC